MNYTLPRVLSSVRRCTAAFSAAIVLGWVISGCQFGGASLIAARQSPPTPQVTQADRDLLSDVPNATDYTHNGRIPAQVAQAADAGPGILICSPPVPGASPPDTGYFADGCTAWLQLMVGGQPQFGRTPAWGNSDRAALVLKEPDLRVSADQASKLSQITGATHAAVGSLAVANGVYTLTYQLLKLPACSPVGTPIAIHGTRDQIVQQLPSLATSLAHQLGGSTIQVATPTGCNADEIAFLGRCRWEYDAVSDADRRHLAQLAQRQGNGLAVMINIDNQTLYSPRERQAAFDLVEHSLAHNALADAEATLKCGDVMTSAERGMVLADASSRPHNYNYAVARAFLARYRKAPAQQQIQASIAAVNCNTNNPGAWRLLADTYSNVGEQIRQGRTVGGISSSQWTQLNMIYPYWIGAYEKAIHLDPYDGSMWQELACAAMSEGYENEADAAERHALALRMGKADIYSWGLQMYQPKWSDDPKKLAAIARMSSNDDSISPADQLTVLDDFSREDYRNLHDMIVNAAIARLQSQIKKSGSDPSLHRTLGDAYALLERPMEARTEYETAIRLAPNDPSLHYALAETIYNMGLYGRAIREYQTVAKLEPEYPNVHFSIGYGYKHLGKLPEAEIELRTELKTYPNSSNAYLGLGDVYALEHKKSLAAAAFLKSAHLEPWQRQAWDSAANYFDESGQYQAALQTIQEARTYFPDDDSLIITLQDIYLKLKQPQVTLQLCKEDLMTDKEPAYIALSHENMAEALLEEHRIPEAVAEWKHVVELNDPQMTATAQHYLAKYDTGVHATGRPLS